MNAVVKRFPCKVEMQIARLSRKSTLRRRSSRKVAAARLKLGTAAIALKAMELPANNGPGKRLKSNPAEAIASRGDCPVEERMNENHDVWVPGLSGPPRGADLRRSRSTPSIEACIAAASTFPSGSNVTTTAAQAEFTLASSTPLSNFSQAVN